MKILFKIYDFRKNVSRRANFRSEMADVQMALQHPANKDNFVIVMIH